MNTHGKANCINLTIFQCRDEIISIGINVVLLIALGLNSIKERLFMIEKVGQGNSLTIVMTIANLIYASSFMLRICFNIVLLSNHESVIQLQCKSCMDGSVGYGMLLFCIHFFCELLPLSAIFTLQLVTIIKAKSNAKLRQALQQKNTE